MSEFGGLWKLQTKVTEHALKMCQTQSLQIVEITVYTLYRRRRTDWSLRSELHLQTSEIPERNVSVTWQYL